MILSGNDVLVKWRSVYLINYEFLASGTDDILNIPAIKYAIILIHKPFAGTKPGWCTVNEENNRVMRIGMSQRIAVQVPMTQEAMVPLMPAGSFTSVAAGDPAWRHHVLSRFAASASYVRRPVLAVGEIPLESIHAVAPLQPLDAFPADPLEIEVLLGEIYDEASWRMFARALARLGARQATLDSRALDAELLREIMTLQNLCQAAYDQRIDMAVRQSVWAYLMALPGFDRDLSEQRGDQAETVHRAHQNTLLRLSEIMIEVEAIFGSNTERLSKVLGAKRDNVRGRVLVASRPGSPLQKNLAWLCSAAACAEVVRNGVGDEQSTRPDSPRALLILDEVAGLPDVGLMKRTIARLSSMRIAVVIGSSKPLDWARSIITPNGIALSTTSVPLPRSSEK